MTSETSAQPTDSGSGLAPHASLHADSEATKGLDSGLQLLHYAPPLKRPLPRGGDEYIFDGIGKVARVSEILEAIIWKGKGFERYKEKGVVEGFQSLVLNSSVTDLYITATANPWHALNAIPEDRAALERGTIVHKAIEKGDFKLRDKPGDVQAYIQAAYSFFELEMPKTEAQEVIVGSRQHRYAGTLDWRGKWGGNRPTLLDFKTATKAGTEPYESYHFQLALYELASTEMGYPSTDGQYVVMLYPDATYKVFPCVATEEDALMAIEWFHCLQRVKERMAA